MRMQVISHSIIAYPPPLPAGLEGNPGCKFQHFPERNRRVDQPWLVSQRENTRGNKK